MRGGRPWAIRNSITISWGSMYLGLLVALLAVRDKRANIVLLILMLARYAVFPVLGFLQIGVHSTLF